MRGNQRRRGNRLAGRETLGAPAIAALVFHAKKIILKSELRYESPSQILTCKTSRSIRIDEADLSFFTVLVSEDQRSSRLETCIIQSGGQHGSCSMH